MSQDANTIIKLITEYVQMSSLEMDWNSERRKEMLDNVKNVIEKGDGMMKILKEMNMKKKQFHQSLIQLEEVEKEVGREIKGIIYEADSLKYEEIMDRIMNKSHLLFIFDCELPDSLNSEEEDDNIGRHRYGFYFKIRKFKYIIYVEEKINCYNNYISHSNTKSFIIDQYDSQYKRNHSFWTINGTEYRKPINEGPILLEGIQVGDKEGKNIFSIKYTKDEHFEGDDDDDDYYYPNLPYFYNERCFRDVSLEKNECIIDKEGRLLMPSETQKFSEKKDRYLIKRIQIIEMKKTEEELEKENQKEKEENKTTNKINKIDMILVSRYFHSINDFINIEKTCKEYNGIIEQYHFNPILLKNEKERELFKNIETYHFYEESDQKHISDIEKDKRIKQFIQWKDINYSEWKRNKKENCLYNNIVFKRQDVENYLSETQNRERNGFGPNHFGGPNQRILRLKNEVIELEEGLTRIGNNCFGGYINLKEITIPSTVKSIGDYCFYYCTDLTSINIPSSVTFIGMFCFYNCQKLSEIKLPNGIRSIESHCFHNCLSLSRINIPTSVTSFGQQCFRKCSNLETINIPSSVIVVVNSEHEYRKYREYSYIQLNSLNIIPAQQFDNLPRIRGFDKTKLPINLPLIGYQCFKGCDNLNVKFPDNMKEMTIEKWGMKGIKSFNIPSSFTSICFSECSNLSDVVVKEGNPNYYREGNMIIKKGTDELVYCIDSKRMKEINIPTNIKCIGSNCFSGCSNLSTITIPSTVTYIRDGCFSGCNKLENIMIEEGNMKYKKEGKEIIEEKGRTNPSLYWKITNEHVINNISTLEEWCGRKCKRILLDSEYVVRGNVDLLLNNKNLCYIVIDVHGNVFGHFMSERIKKKEKIKFDNNIFLFTLYTNGKENVKKYGQTKEVGMKIFRNRHDDMYCLISKFSRSEFYYGINPPFIAEPLGFGGGSHICNIKNCFNGLNNDDLNGIDCTNREDCIFIKKVIVIQMEETEVDKEREKEKRKRKEKERRIMLSKKGCIINNMNILEEWSGCKFNRILYDSETDGKTSEMFRKKIMNHSKLYFIVIDENNNVFGHYHPSLITKINKENHDKDMFMFSLYSNGRPGIERYENKTNQVYTFLYSNNNFYHAGLVDGKGYGVCEGDSFIGRPILEVFDIPDKKTITGGDENSSGDINFNWKEIIVVEMKEAEEEKEKERENEQRHGQLTPSQIVGKRVKRGRDWNQGNRDGGEGSLGTVTMIIDDGWVHVEWDNGNSGRYRCGAEGAYDLDVVE